MIQPVDNQLEVLRKRLSSLASINQRGNSKTFSPQKQRKITQIQMLLNLGRTT